MFDPAEYTITIKKTDLDGDVVFKYNVQELPDVEGYEDTNTAAYDAAIEIIQSLYDLSKEMGKDFPLPKISSNEYSGRVTLRMGKSLHRTLALISDEEGVSLNQYIVSQLSIVAGASTKPQTNQPIIRNTSEYIAAIYGGSVTKHIVGRKIINSVIVNSNYSSASDIETEQFVGTGFMLKKTTVKPELLN